MSKRAPQACVQYRLPVQAACSTGVYCKSAMKGYSAGELYRRAVVACNTGSQCKRAVQACSGGLQHIHAVLEFVHRTTLICVHVR